MLNLFLYSFPSIINFIIALLWVPLLLSILIVRYKDLAQIIPVLLQFLFLTSPILYTADRLGKLKIMTDINPMYKIVSHLRDSINNGVFLWLENLNLLIINVIGFLLTLLLLAVVRRKLPFFV